MQSATFLDRLDGTGLAIAVVVLLFLNFARGALETVLSFMARREQKRNDKAAACLYPLDLADKTRDAVGRQSQIAEANQSAIERLESSIDRLVEAMGRMSEQIITALAELRARGRR